MKSLLPAKKLGFSEEVVLQQAGHKNRIRPDICAVGEKGGENGGDRDGANGSGLIPPDVGENVCGGRRYSEETLLDAMYEKVSTTGGAFKALQEAVLKYVCVWDCPQRDARVGSHGRGARALWDLRRPSLVRYRRRPSPFSATRRGLQQLVSELASNTGPFNSPVSGGF